MYFGIVVPISVISMPSALKTSEAAALGLHASAMLAAEPKRPLSCQEMASALRVSAHHLSKVLQRLARAGVVVAARGPKGGFTLGRPAQDISLLEVYEAVDGPLALSPCLFHKPACNGTCMLGGLLSSVNKQVEETLRNTRVADLACFAGQGTLTQESRDDGSGPPQLERSSDGSVGPTTGRG